ncbi:MAG: FAD-binding oxidoreductase, partial [Alphaproteobacteria bacterium]|nr:FAD-binding oxidoreductase [Alphaproteobacteria bacterium]
MADRKLKYWGWGFADDGLSADQTTALLKTFADGFDIRPTAEGKRPEIADISLAAPRLTPPASLAKICTSDAYERVLHSFGQSQPDSIRT